MAAEELKADAQILAEAHRAACTMSVDCIKNCPESSPLYWAKALMPGQTRKALPVQRSTVARTLSTVAAVVEHQGQVIEDAQVLVNEFDGSPDDIPELLETLRQVLSRDV